MTDRELLENAAKAVGGGAWHPLTHDTPNGRWNPLTDDGDALRLAVKLSLEIDAHYTGVAVRTPEGRKILVEADEVPDPYAATRRAIVRAAAAIGAAKPWVDADTGEQRVTPRPAPHKKPPPFAKDAAQ